MKEKIRQEGAIKDKLEERGYTVEGIPCIFHNHKGNVHMRRIIQLEAAPKVSLHSPIQSQPSMKLVDIERSKRMVALFDLGKPASQIFAV